MFQIGIDDRKWMLASRLSSEYENGLEEFIKFAKSHSNDPNRIKCPCTNCGCIEKVSVGVLKDHLFVHGIDRSYTTWIWDGERVKEYQHVYIDDREEVFSKEGDNLKDMMNDVEGNFLDWEELFQNLKTDSEKPLYNGCSKFTKLSVVLRLYNLKAGNGWSDKSFTALLDLLKDMLPEDNELPKHTYEAKKILFSIGMD